jgi:hypothetical protein
MNMDLRLRRLERLLPGAGIGVRAHRMTDPELLDQAERVAQALLPEWRAGTLPPKDCEALRLLARLRPESFGILLDPEERQALGL